MGHQLKQLLGNDHPLFVANLAALEKAVGHEGIDTKLLADIMEHGHEILRSQGLDPADTRAREAYKALGNLARRDAAHTVFHDSDYVLLQFGDELVSFNLQDIIENAHHELSFENRIIGSAQRHLRAEIIRRYAEHDRSNNEMVHELAKEIGLKPPSDEGHPDIHHPLPVTAASILAVGDIFTDAFIQLSEDSAKIHEDPDGSKWLSVPFGAKPSYDHVDIVKSVGPSPNTAISVARLGVNASLLAWLGDDQAGKESLEHLRSEGVSTDMMVTQPKTKSSYWYVLRYGSDRTMLVKSEPYKYEWKNPEKEPDWIYLSYIGADSWPLHEQLLAYLNEHPKVKLAFQPGTFHFSWGVDKLRGIYGRAHVVLMNREEAMDVTGKPHESVRDLANGLHELGPKIVVITDGPDGSYASYDWKLVTIPNYPDPAPPLDRTGAGDAFSSVIVAGLAMGETMDTALTWAPINSMNVVQKIGAQTGLLTLDEIKEYLAKAPDSYKITEVK